MKVPASQLHLPLPSAGPGEEPALQEMGVPVGFPNSPLTSESKSFIGRRRVYTRVYVCTHLHTQGGVCTHRAGQLGLSTLQTLLGGLRPTEGKALHYIKHELGKHQTHPGSIQFQPHLWGCGTDVPVSASGGETVL